MERWLRGSLRRHLAAVQRRDRQRCRVIGVGLEGAAAAATERGGAVLLDDVGQLVGEQRVAERRARIVEAGRERDLVADRERARAERRRELAGRFAGVDPDVAEAVEERRLHRRARGSAQRLAGAQLPRTHEVGGGVLVGRGQERRQPAGRRCGLGRLGRLGPDRADVLARAAGTRRARHALLQLGLDRGTRLRLPLRDVLARQDRGDLGEELALGHLAGPHRPAVLDQQRPRGLTSSAGTRAGAAIEQARGREPRPRREQVRRQAPLAGSDSAPAIGQRRLDAPVEVREPLVATSSSRHRASPSATSPLGTAPTKDPSMPQRNPQLNKSFRVFLANRREVNPPSRGLFAVRTVIRITPGCPSPRSGARRARAA